MSSKTEDKLYLRLECTQPEVVEGLAEVVAGLSYGRPVYERESIEQALNAGTAYTKRPISPGPDITLELSEKREQKNLYALAVENRCNGAAQMNFDKAITLVDRYLGQYILNAEEAAKPSAQNL